MLSTTFFASAAALLSVVSAVPADTSAAPAAQQVLVLDDTAYATATPTILSIDGATTAYKVTLTAVERGQTITATPSITLRPSSYDIIAQSSTSNKEIGKLSFMVSQGCSLTTSNNAAYLTRCQASVSLSTGLEPIVTSVLSNAMSSINRAMSTELIGPLVTKAAVVEDKSKKSSASSTCSSIAMLAILPGILLVYML